MSYSFDTASKNSSTPANNSIFRSKKSSSFLGGEQPFVKSGSPVQKKSEKTGNLPDAIQAKMEHSFGADFSAVNVHTNSKSADDLKAVAYTQGNDIHFSSKYNPYSATGQEYLGHELSHVLQQNAGMVGTTHQEGGFNVNGDPGLERQADDAGRRAASGQSAGMNISSAAKSGGSASIQKKNAPIQMLRLLPAGAPIFELAIDPEQVIQTFSSLWNTFKGFGWLNTNFKDHPDLPDKIREICGNNYFRGTNFYMSEWFDDNFNDLWSLGSLDNDVKISMQMYIDNEVLVNSGNGNFTSGGTTTDTRSNSTTKTISGEASGEASGTGGKGGGKVGASVSQTDSRTMSVSGSNGLSMNTDAQVKKANVKFKCKLFVNPTFLSMRTQEKYSGSVGTIRFGAPA